jgi:hypothetical protein
VRELLEPRLGKVINILTELSNVLIEIREFIQRGARFQNFCQVLQLAGHGFSEGTDFLPFTAAREFVKMFVEGTNR